MPLPEEDGFNVRPGTKTSVEITKVLATCDVMVCQALRDIRTRDSATSNYATVQRHYTLIHNIR